MLGHGRQVVVQYSNPLFSHLHTVVVPMARRLIDGFHVDSTAAWATHMPATVSFRVDARDEMVLHWPLPKAIQVEPAQIKHFSARLPRGLPGFWTLPLYVQRFAAVKAVFLHL